MHWLLALSQSIIHITNWAVTSKCIHRNWTVNCCKLMLHSLQTTSCGSVQGILLLRTQLCSYYTVHFVDKAIFQSYVMGPTIAASPKKRPPDTISGTVEPWFCIIRYHAVRSVCNNCQSFLIGSCRCDILRAACFSQNLATTKWGSGHHDESLSIVEY